LLACSPIFTFHLSQTDGDAPTLRLGNRVLSLGAAGAKSSVTSMNLLIAPLCAEDGANHQIILETSTGTVIIGKCSFTRILKRFDCYYSIARSFRLKCPIERTLLTNFSFPLSFPPMCVYTAPGTAHDVLSSSWAGALVTILKECSPAVKLPASVDSPPTDPAWNPKVTYGGDGDRDVRIEVNVGEIDCDYCG
jgi:hypothetical protein